MATFRSSGSAIPERRFGRGKSFVLAHESAASTISDDLRLFALTFVGGFLFITVYLA
jgi:hypothetical protein